MSTGKRPSDDELLDAWEADAEKCCRSCALSAAHLRSGSPDYVGGFLRRIGELTLAGFLRRIGELTRERDAAREYAMLLHVRIITSSVVQPPVPPWLKEGDSDE